MYTASCIIKANSLPSSWTAVNLTFLDMPPDADEPTKANANADAVEAVAEAVVKANAEAVADTNCAGAPEANTNAEAVATKAVAKVVAEANANADEANAEADCHDWQANATTRTTAALHQPHYPPATGA